MPSSNPQDVARRFIQSWNAGRRDIVDELAADDLVVSYTHFPEPLPGPDAFKEMLAQTHRYFPDLAIEVSDVVADDGQVVVSWTYRGTFRNGEMFGVEAEGQSVEVDGMTRLHVKDGTVHREEGIVDNLGLMMQIGAFPGADDRA